MADSAQAGTTAMTPYKDKAQILEHIEKMSRTPFQDILADLIACSPDIESIKAFANKYPDRWAQAMTIVSGLAGFDKGNIVNNTNILVVGQMSDVELMRELGQLNEAMGKLLAQQGVEQAVIDAMPVVEGGETFEGEVTVVPEPAEGGV